MVVGRRAAWGGPFASLRTLQPGQLIVTSTTQGQSVYRVTAVRTSALRRRDAGPTDDDRLTLITSASAWPSSSTRAVVVRAKLMGTPFEPTAQGTRPAGTVGHLGDSDGTDRLVLCVLVFALAAVGGREGAPDVEAPRRPPAHDAGARGARRHHRGGGHPPPPRLVLTRSRASRGEPRSHPD